jgi:crotonobetainyl-CoA:carnitine CoA-transferase CaiB-like acyl-CoA transferase
VTEPGPGALAGLRVLDLTGHRAQLCARLLADMGADVIKVEQPGGDDARRIGPFLDDLPHHDRSLFFWFYNLNKRSLTLDLKHSRGADILLQLVRTADVVIESFAPGTMGHSPSRESRAGAVLDCAVRADRPLSRLCRR